MSLAGKFERKLIRDLLLFAVRRRPVIVPITLLGIASSIIELAAMLSVIPLGLIAGGRPIGGRRILSLADHLGLILNSKFFIVLFLSLFLLRTATYILTQALNGYVGHSIMADLSTKAFATFVRDLSFTNIHKHQIGHFVTLAGDEASRGSQIVVNFMRLAPVAILFLLYGLILLFSSWQAFVGLVIFILLTTASLQRIFRKTMVLGQRIQEESRDAHTHFIESLGGLRTIRSFTAEGFIVSRYAEMLRRYTRTLSISEALANLNQIPIFACAAMALFVVAVFYDDALLRKEMPAILAGIMIFFRLLPIANQGLENALRLTANLRAGRNVADMLRAASVAGQSASLPDLSDDERITSIEFDSVTFRYADDTPKILDRFSRTLKAGKSYALTGPSGIGKSSLIDLMLKFFVPLDGHIRINGKDIAQLSNASIRRHILLSEQTTRIFYGSVMENVRFGMSGNDAQAHEALAMVGLKEMLSNLPEGVDTILNFQGSNLSGGQRQRVGIARALSRTSDVLVMDESTNALDSGTRERVLESIMTSYSDRILIFVTHDPYVIARVDEVIELQGSAPSSVMEQATP